jgi:membrane-bound serine protease (ClpP class)
MAGLLLCAPPLAAGAAHVNLVKIDGSINPASSDYLQNAIAQSEADGAEALLLELDTPGGLLAATKDIVQAMLNARVPVIVFVSPRGAWAASAGAFVTMAGHIAAMAPARASALFADQRERGALARRRRQARGRRLGRRKFTTAFVEAIAKQRKRNAVGREGGA